MIMKMLYVGLGASLMISVEAFAGDLSKRSFSQYFEWNSTDCNLPTEPYIYELDESNKYLALSYIDDIEEYQDCVSREASEDYRENIKQLASAIEEGRDESIEDANEELASFLRRLGL